MKNFNLIEGLFTNQRVDNSSKSISTATKRTFKIADESWQDFVDLVSARRTTQAEMINGLIRQAVADGADEIARYREFYGIKKPQK